MFVLHFLLHNHVWSIQCFVFVRHEYIQILGYVHIMHILDISEIANNLDARQKFEFYDECEQFIL